MEKKSVNILREIYVGEGKQYEKISEAANDILLHNPIKPTIF